MIQVLSKELNQQGSVLLDQILRKATENEGRNTKIDNKLMRAREKELLERITAARSACMSAQSVNDKVAADNLLTSALAGLKVSVENYPDLKANQNFLQLQSELADIENKLAAVRRFFNSATKELNNSVQSFPNNLIANMFGFHKEPMFEVAPEQRAAIEKAPTVSF
jgi:LemA protein